MVSAVFRLRKAAGALRAMKTSYKFDLLALPNELVAAIIEQVDKPATLCLLSRTCRRIQYLAEPVLYRQALVSSSTGTARLLHSFNARSERAAALQTLDIPCDSNYAQNFRDLSILISQASNLKSLMIESPQCNDNIFEDEEDWEAMVRELFQPFQNAASTTATQKPLQKLQRLVLHLNGSESPYWTLDRRGLSLFLMPSLVYLKISCVNIPGEVADLISQKSCPSLKHLELEESNITHKGLEAVLSLPRALETLYLGENCHNIRHFGNLVDPASNHLFATDAGATLHALHQQSQTLKKLTYVMTETYHQHHHRRLTVLNKGPTDAGFADFHSLESIILVGRCPHFERAVMSSRSPPNLKELVFKTENVFRAQYNEDYAPGRENIYDAIPFLRAPSSSIPPTLERLDVIYHSPPLTSQDLTSSLKDFIQKAAKATEKAGFKLRVLTSDHTTYYPPFLYGEPVPQDHVIYDGGWTDCLTSQARRPTRLWASVED